MNRTKKTWTQEIDEKFLQSVLEGDLEKVRFYADKGADLYQTDEEGRKNPLRLATIRGNFDIVKFLVEERGVSPGKDVRILHMALMSNNSPKEMFRYHVDHGANINQIDPTLGTPLMVTIREDSDFTLAKWVVEQGANVNVRCSHGTALHNTVEFGNRDLLDFMMQHGAKPSLDLTDSRSFTPLILAASIGRDDMIYTLVQDYGLSPNQQTDVTPLLMATQHRRISSVKLLLKLGADPQLAPNQVKCTALHLAASNEFLDIIDALLDAGAEVDCEDPRGYTPLLMAGTEGYTNVCRQLLERGANPNHRSHSDHSTPIFLCANKDRVEVVKLLLMYGAEMHTTLAENGETIAEIARQEKRLTMANLLESFPKAKADDSVQKMCGNCYFYETGKMKLCNRCKSLWYCSVECQKKHWPTHKNNCKPIN
eukprot:TRINITY_DN445_c0_g2_i12.p1 TRINITY_DN445_c0_g2~~TRINITY_DN445_c0_g2_i12.p1  ORF type:complete len:425 (-),score=78.84 TRINITY_DN445_c0_g2_i12:135-1409(-)